MEKKENKYMECKYEDKIIQLCENVATLVERVEIPMKAIDKHINQGHIWRTAVTGLGLTVIINIIVFANMYGKMTKTVETNSVQIQEIIAVNNRLSVLEEKVSLIEEIVVDPLLVGD